MGDTDRGTLKRPGDDALEEKAMKRQRDLEMEGDQNGDIWTLLVNEPDETLNEVMKLLGAADNGASCTNDEKLRFINDPYSPSSCFTVNGNEESCGSSFSELQSTCMAGVDICGGWLGIGAEIMGLDFDRWLMEEAKEEESGGACGVIEEAARGGGLSIEAAEWDDAALARFIGEDLL